MAVRTALTAVVWWLVLTLSGAESLAAAAPPGRLLADYTHTAWTRLQGAPSDVVKFAQTTDGWLWLASSIGLYRFDGKQFERMDSIGGQRLYSSNVMGLMAGPDGSLWVGHRFGGISVFSATTGKVRMRLFTQADGLPGGAIFSITRGPDGAVWAATSYGLGHLAPGATRFRTVSQADGLPDAAARQVLFTRSGRQWVSVAGGVYFRDTPAQRFQRGWPYLDLMALAETADGTLWGSDGVDRQYRIRTGPPPGPARPRAELAGNGMHVDRDGGVWLLKGGALERHLPAAHDAASQRLTMDNGLSGPLPQTFFQDREGALWIGTSNGLDRLRRNRLQALRSAAPLDHPMVVADAAGSILVGDASGPLRSYDAAGAVRSVIPARLTASYRAPDGSLWLANDSERWQRGAAGVTTRHPHPALVAGRDTQAMTQDGAGRMWASVSRLGLFRVDAAGWIARGGLTALPEDPAMSMATDARGRVWVGYARNRIAVIDGDKVRVFGAVDGLALGNVLALCVDGARVWGGGEAGLARIDADAVTMIGGSDGQPFLGVSGIVRSHAGDGDLWLHGSDGITRIARADSEAAAARVRYERFDAQDGLQGSAEQVRPIPSLTQGSDGRLWFATGSDVASLDPRRIARNRLAPPVQISAVHAAGVSYPAAAEIALPTGTSDLQIGYTALSLAMPERVHFRYRLDGVDHDWQDTLGRREAFYTNLQPGRYRFQVIAANEDGVWNTDGAAITLTITPRFAQTTWFVVLLVLGGLMLLGALYLLRMRHLNARLRDLQQERLDERARIARGLHDTLLQSVQGLIMFFDQHARRLAPGAEERRKIEQTLELADQLMVEGRDCIIALRSGDTPDALDQTLTQYGEVLLAGRFSASVEGTARPLNETVRGELHAIGREALLNAGRHSGASAVHLQLVYGAQELRLHVSDNGRGIARGMTTTSPPGHYGLAGMQERAGAIGAACAVVSGAAGGVTVQLTMPAQLAYLERRDCAWLGRMQRRLSRK